MKKLLAAARSRSGKNNGKNNICGEKILSYQTKPSQRGLTVKMQLMGVGVDKNAVQRIECGKGFVTDIELKVFAEVLGVSIEKLIE